MIHRTGSCSRPGMTWLTAIGLTLFLWGPLVQALPWPQQVAAPEGNIIVYQPQPESLVGNVLTGRAAVSLELTDKADPIFGAMWFSARIDTDRDAGTAVVSHVKVTKVGWPDSKEASEQRFTQIVESAIPQAGFEISMDQLSSSLANADIEQKSLEKINNDPPKIVFSEQLAVLLLYDGAPQFSAVDNSDYERALNAPLVVARNTKSDKLYLSSGALWYQSRDPLGPWTPTDAPPPDLVKMLPAPDPDAQAPKTPPAIVVATKPTELISTDGKANWKSLPGGEVLYVENTESPWLRELSSGDMYLLLSGRWYRSMAQAGPWTFVRSDQLPASFRNIPPASDIGGLRVSVSDTDEAEDAMLDAAIPQTAAIKRSEASLTVEYDGTPRFEKIAGTSVSYAVNTGAQVLKVQDRYYAVDSGVWFTATSPEGPWTVADSIPQEEIRKIPPSSPVYNTTHVNIYESTPDVVYVGYTPGYLWSFPYYGVPVYGTGFYYPPYRGSLYYPRPPTWGFNVGYNPWSGWNFGLSWSSGFFSFGVSWGGGWGGSYRPWGCCGGWYGGGYRGPTVINTGDINIGNNVNIGNRKISANRIGDNKTMNARRIDNRNVYKRPANRARIADPSKARHELKRARPTQGRANDLYADKNGSVAKRVDDGWEARSDGAWKPQNKLPEDITPEKRDAAKQAIDRSAPQTRDPTTRQTGESVSQAKSRISPQIDQKSLNRDYSARQAGASRERARHAPRGGGGRARGR
ncbi:MAG: carbohydrate-binding family V/XII [Pseudomonadota bacterium]|nr:carbohydrate-binding family V/XII [Pseudomonadota bacterium]